MDTPDFIDSKFRLAILAAKRAKQLVHGAKKKVDINAENPLTVAMEEIRQEKISFQVLNEDALELEREAAAREEMEAARALDADELTDETGIQDITDLLDSADAEIEGLVEEEFEDEEPEGEEEETAEEDLS